MQHYFDDDYVDESVTPFKDWKIGDKALVYIIEYPSRNKVPYFGVLVGKISKGRYAENALMFNITVNDENVTVTVSINDAMKIGAPRRIRRHRFNFYDPDFL